MVYPLLPHSSLCRFLWVITTLCIFVSHSRTQGIVDSLLLGGSKCKMLGSLFKLTFQCCAIWVRIQKGDRREEFYFFPFSDSVKQYLSQASHSNITSISFKHLISFSSLFTSKWTALVVAPWKIEPAGTIEHLTSEKGCKHQSEQMLCHFCSASIKNSEHSINK